MAHLSLELEDHGPYSEGDSLEILIVVLDEDGEERVDIGGSTVEFRVKEEQTDDDNDALLELEGTHGDGGSDVRFTDPANGEAVIVVEAGETDGFLDTEDGGREREAEFWFHVRVIDEDGNQVTTHRGWWEMEAS